MSALHNHQRPHAWLLMLCLFYSVSAFAQKLPYDRVVVFGTSLSDAGNAFKLLKDPEAFGFNQCTMGVRLNVPPYDQMDKLLDTDIELIVPDGVYALGGHHLTNGASWIEQLAHGQGFSGNVRPALLSPGIQASNYAVGGARAREVTSEDPEYDVISCRFNLSDQVQAYISDFQVDANTNPISVDTLIVIEMGSNDVRDALESLNPTYVITKALENISFTIQTLYSYGARQFLLMNVPNIARTPAVNTINAFYNDFVPDVPTDAIKEGAKQLSENFNLGLAGIQLGFISYPELFPDIQIKTLDLYALLEDVVTSYGFSNVTDACITPNIAPFACKKPDTYVFWDGVHPTKAVHAIMAEHAVQVLQE